MVKRRAPTTSSSTGRDDTPPAGPRAPHGGQCASKPVQRRAEAHDDGPLESLGKAITAPVLGAANPDDDEKPQ